MKFRNLNWIISSMSIIVLLNVFSCQKRESAKMETGVSGNIQKQIINKMVEKFGDENRNRIEKGVKQVGQRWYNSDGTTEEMEKFCLDNFYTDSQAMDVMFGRYMTNLESLYGNLHRIQHDWNWNIQVDTGPIAPVDYLFASFDPYAHVTEDMFKSRLAFVVLLNYPIYTLEEKSTDGESWSRKKWAEVRLVEHYIDRIPAAAEQKRTEAYTLSDDYIANYNIYMHNLLDTNKQRLFPEGLKLISHWGLRDELKAQYANPEGLPRQRMIQQVMERIVTQEIPKVVVDNPDVDWNPFTNSVYEAGTDSATENTAEATRRYENLLSIFHAEQGIDPYTPATPSLIDRRFKEDREILEKDVEKMIISILTAPVLKDIATLIQIRLGRELEPFDIWYDGFKPRGKYSEEKLDAIVGKEYPTVAAFEKDLPFILRGLGFSPEKAEFLAEHIAVDPSRGAGHAMGARMKEDKAHLRTRIPEGGMKYKGFNIAIHELGHNVEQVFSLNEMDYYTLEGVPNTAFTEALAFVFQDRDLSLLGLDTTDPQADDLSNLNDMWSAYEIAGVSLVDMNIWRWMYAHPNAGAAEVRDAMISIAKDVWNKYYAPVFGIQDQILLAVYSHIISYGMYIPDYLIGSAIAFQIEDYLKDKSLATEMERMCKLGNIAPQVWMKRAVGSPISAQPMIDAAGKSVKNIADLASK
jgi:hypothetical protein